MKRLNFFAVSFLIVLLTIECVESQTLRERYLPQYNPASTLDSGFTSWQWLNPLPQGNPLFCVDMIDSNTIVASGINTFIRTTNSGLTWSVRQRVGGVLENPGLVHFIDQNSGLMLLQSGRILTTTDGGDTWVEKSSNLREQMKSFFYLGGVCWVDDTTIVLLQDEGFLLRTSDGGSYWAVQETGTNFRLSGIDFINKDTGTVVGEGIIRTTNGGITWVTQRTFLKDTILTGVSFGNSNVGIAFGDGKILRTTNGGLEWNDQSVGSGVIWRCAQFLNPEICIIFGDHGAILRTTDGGQNWVSDFIGELEMIIGMSFVNERLGTAVGFWGTILKTTNSGESWSRLSKGTTETLRRISFGDAATGIAVSVEGTIIRTTNGGVSWMQSVSPLVEDFRDMCMNNPWNGIAIGVQSILRTTDAGETWMTILKDSLTLLTAVSFANEDTGLVVGFGVNYLTTNSGLTWKKNATGQIQAFGDVTFFDGVAWGVGSGSNEGRIERTTDYGNTWIVQFTHAGVDFSKVSFASPTHGIAVGMEGIVANTTNGGDTWSLRTLDSRMDIFGIQCLDSMNAVLVGYNPDWSRIIFRTTDGGNNWSQWNTHLFSYLIDVTAVSSQSGRTLFAVGAAGSIICAAVSPLNSKTWTWTGLYDSSWNNPINWSPVGTPLPGDSVIIAQATHSPIVDSVQQQIVIASLNILSGGKLTITDVLPRFVVLADVTVYGTLEIRPPASTTIIIGGNWTIQPGGSEERFAHLSKPNSFKLNDEGFIPYHSTVLFSGGGIMAGNFYNVMFDTTSSMRSIGNISFQNQCTMVGDVNLRTNDTVYVQASFPQALVGPGKFKRGTIKRVIQSGELESYSFESNKTFVQFHGSGTYPAAISMTTYPESSPTIIANRWTVIPSRVDTLNNIITADTVKEFSKWVFGIPRPTGMEKDLEFGIIDDTIPIVGRLYNIHAEGGSGFNARLSLRYEQFEVPEGVIEDSLKLIRIDSIVVGVKPDAQEIPERFVLAQNYPNPFNPSTTIRYELPKASFVTLKVYNLLGQEVAMLVDGFHDAGFKSVEFDGSKLPSGMYIYRMQAGEFIESKKLLILK